MHLIKGDHCFMILFFERRLVSWFSGLSWCPGWSAPGRWRWFSQTATAGWERRGHTCSWRLAARSGCSRYSCYWRGDTDSYPGGKGVLKRTTLFIGSSKPSTGYLFPSWFGFGSFYWKTLKNMLYALHSHKYNLLHVIMIMIMLKHYIPLIPHLFLKLTVLFPHNNGCSCLFFVHVGSEFSNVAGSMGLHGCIIQCN